MKILVVGRGWTGNKMYSALVDRGHNVKICSHTDAIDVISTADTPQYDWVVNCAGVTGFPNVDACELYKNETMEGNTIFPIKLSGVCKQKNIRFAHFSSGCIYHGTIDSVDAEPNFYGSTYSITKGITDVALRNEALILRIRMPFTGRNENKNYLTKVKRYAKTAKLIDAGQNSLTDHDEAVKVACDLIEENAPNKPYNLVNSGSIDMHELAEMLEITPQWFTPEEFKAVTRAARSTCTIPDCGRMKPVREALKTAIERMKET
jgi:dTDP-4-dehydrorhamnose reductase